jgi:hypothetical protein
MSSTNLLTLSVLGVICTALTLPAAALAKPKGSAKQCTTQDLNTNFGKSCNDQAQQDLMGNKPHYHLLICGGDTMLCCTFDSNTNQVQTCRKPAGARVMPGTHIGATGSAGVQSRAVEGGDAADEEAPVPSSLTPDVAKELLKHHKAK